MKFHALFAVTALTWRVQAMSSNTRGVRGQHHASLLRDFRRHLYPVPDHDVGPMLKSAESMLMDLASRHGGTPLADLVAQVRPFILQMQDSIRAAHTSAQQILTNFDGDFSGCSTAKSTGESEATSLENIKKGHSDDHKACRTAEKSAHDQFSSCESNLNNMQGAKDSSCQLYANAARTPGCGAIAPNPGETWKSYVTRAATWFESERDSYLHKEEVCNNDTAKLQAQTTTCTGSDGSGGQKKEHEDKKDECDATQSQLETATCSYVTKVDGTCESFASCQNTVVDGYEAQLTGIQTLEHQRQVEWNATERLLCMLGAYGADGSVDATKLQTCQLIGDNTSHLNLVYPTAASRPGSCPDLLPHPCEADYISQEYSGLHAPAKACTPCAIPVAGSSANANGGGSSASTANGAGSASNAGSSSPQDPGVEPPANYCDNGPGWMAGQCLLWAHNDGNLEYLKYLLANGADVNAGPTAWPTWTPLFCALYYQNSISTEAVKLFIAYGADVNKIETDSGRTPVWAAESRGTDEEKRIMYDAGAVLCCGGNCEGVSAPNCADVTFP